MIIVLFGAPGAGKGSQGNMIKTRLDQLKKKSHMIIMGDILRTMSKYDNNLKNILDSGTLLSSDRVNSVMKDYFNKINYKKEDICIFDGYPRSIAQAEFLYHDLYQDGKFIVVNIDINETVATKRILSRMVCDNCKMQLNINNEKDLVCSRCGKNQFSKRGDDNQETFAKRFKAYIDKTQPVLNYYKSLEQINIISINGDNDIKIINKYICNKIFT